MSDVKLIALVMNVDGLTEYDHDDLKEAIKNVTVCQYDDCRLEYDGAEYLVYTDDEADQAWDEALESYIEECVLFELPSQYRNYFDHEAFKRDARYDGRGHALSTYDGDEGEENVNGEWHYIYRVN